ncbi:MAG: WD40 repeat domain-containing protein, partial [Anaerolineales bacterium]|nr:WD40 repeat domain-containing protein [Anaerolineales bacterium]
GMLASGSYDKTIKLWDISMVNCVRTLEGHTGWVESVVFNKDGLLASGSRDNTIKLWDVATMTCVGTLEGHPAPVWSVAFSPDGKLLGSGSGDRTIKLWDTSTMTCVGTLEGYTDAVYSVAFNGAGLLAGVNGDKTISLTHIYTQEFIMTSLLCMKRCGLIPDVRDLIMMRMGVIDKRYKKSCIYIKCHGDNVTLFE